MDLQYMYGEMVTLTNYFRLMPTKHKPSPKLQQILTLQSACSPRLWLR